MRTHTQVVLKLLRQIDERQRVKDLGHQEQALEAKLPRRIVRTWDEHEAHQQHGGICKRRGVRNGLGCGLETVTVCVKVSTSIKTHLVQLQQRFPKKTQHILLLGHHIIGLIHTTIASDLK